MADTDFGVAASEINRAILETFRQARLVIPFPQRAVRMVAAAEVARARCHFDAGRDCSAGLAFRAASAK